MSIGVLTRFVRLEASQKENLIYFLLCQSRQKTEVCRSHPVCGYRDECCVMASHGKSLSKNICVATHVATPTTNSEM
jgi:hypothetical protein